MLQSLKTTLSLTAILFLATACGDKGKVKDTSSELNSYQYNQSSENEAMNELSKDGNNLVHFAYNSYDLSSKSKAILQNQLATLQNYMSVKVLIAGHCDERGTYEYNLALGERRANAVKNFLVSNGVSAERIEVTSYSSEKPLDLGHDESAYAKNRRSETAVVESK